ncbi:unnamed protein product, partial [Brassica oleracea]
MVLPLMKMTMKCTMHIQPTQLKALLICLLLQIEGSQPR